MMKNYQIELDKIIKGISADAKKPTLLLHGCCAPCSSYVLEYLSTIFKITLFFYNPNIFPENEYLRRLEEEKRLIDSMDTQEPIKLIAGPYNKELFYTTIEGLEDQPEGGMRCKKCFELRLELAAKTASEQGLDYYTTTLSISPHKNAELLNTIGEHFGNLYNIKHLPADFKKRNGFKRSIELSEKYGLYRQDYCGCEFSQK